MPWTGDQLPWSAPISKPSRPSGPYEPLNYFPGNPVLRRGKGSSSLVSQLLEFFPGGPVLRRGKGSASLPNQILKNFPGGPVISGKGLKPFYPNRTTLQYLYNPTVLPGTALVIQALRLKGR